MSTHLLAGATLTKRLNDVFAANRAQLGAINSALAHLGLYAVAGITPQGVASIVGVAALPQKAGVPAIDPSLVNTRKDGTMTLKAGKATNAIRKQMADTKIDYLDVVSSVIKTDVKALVGGPIDFHAISDGGHVTYILSVPSDFTGKIPATKKLSNRASQELFNLASEDCGQPA